MYHVSISLRHACGASVVLSSKTAVKTSPGHDVLISCRLSEKKIKLFYLLEI